jgi:membrane-bound serine protease (ClpP class)
MLFALVAATVICVGAAAQPSKASGLLATTLSPAAQQAPASQPAKQVATIGRSALPSGPVAVIELAGQIDDYNAGRLFTRVDRARRSGAKIIILQIDTYGGQVGAAMNISRFIKNQTDLYFVGFINSKAISAGAMIAMACQDIVMTPSATFGDCAPIQLSESGDVRPMAATERQKVESPIITDFRESAERNGYPPAIGVAMVALPNSVHWIENSTGERQFVDADSYRTLTADGQWKPVPGEPNPIDGPDTLLTLNTQQAVRYGLASGTAQSADELAAARGWTVSFRYAQGWGDWVIALLMTPGARMVMLIIFLNALFVAVKTPGSGAAEAIAVLSLAMVIGMPLLTGHALWWQAALVVIGLALVLFEVFVFPGVFVGLVAGLVLMLGGLLLTFMTDAWSIPGGWSLQSTWSGLERGIWVVVGGLAGSLALFTVIRQFLPQLPVFNRLILQTPAAHPDIVVVAPGTVSEDVWPFPGTVGTTVTDLRPGGSAQFPYGADTRVTSVVGEDGFVPTGTRIVVREVHGSRVVVRVAPLRDA